MSNRLDKIDKAMMERVQQHIRSTYGKDASLISDVKQTTIAERDAVVHDIKDTHKKNFDQKIYMFPESYNQLRKELYEHWPNLWKFVSYRMAYKAEEFMECMNGALSMNIVFDSERVDGICKAYLNRLWELRGESRRV